MEKNQPNTIWTSHFIRISLTQLIVFTVFYALLTTLPMFVTGTLNESQSSAGLVVTFMLVAAIMVRPFSAKILDLLGRKRTLVISAGFFTLTTFFYVWMDQLLPLLTLRFIHGISFGIVTTAMSAIAADIIPASRRGEGMGYFAMATNIAIVIGPFLALTILQTASFHTLFIILNGLILIAVYCAITVRAVEYERPPKHERPAFSLKLHDLIEPKAIPVGIISGLVGFAYASILSFVSVHADELGLASTASYFFLVFAVIMIAFRPYLGRAFDQKGAKAVLVPSLLFFSIGLLTLGLTNSAFVLLLAGAFIGLGYGTLLPGFQTLSIQTTTPQRSGYAISTFFIFYDLGIAAGAFVWGHLVSWKGFSTMYIASAILVIITLIAFYMYATKKERAEGAKKTTG